MKRIQNVFQRLAVCVVAIAMVTSVTAQTAAPGSAKVVRIKGPARYTTGNNVWLPLKTGALLKSGTLIQTSTERGSFVDLVLGDGEVPIARPAMVGEVRSRSYTPNADQNIVRLFENTVLKVDALTSMETGAGTVSETQLDLQRGRIFGNVKKMSAASRYEVKLPNGVAGIRGTIYTLSAEGVVKVLVGSAVLAYEMRIGPNVPPTTYAVDHTIYYISPTTGHNGNQGGNGPPPGP